MTVSSSLRNSQAARQELQKVLNEVSQLRTDVRRVDGYYQDGQRDSQDAQSQLRFTQSPIMSAERDNAQTNVSSYGYQIDNYVRTTQREIESCDRNLNSADSQSRNVKTEIGEVKNGITRVKGMVAEQPAVLEDLNKAGRGMEDVERNHNSADGNAGWADNKNSSADRQLRFSESYIRDICYDRPGQDVSSSARMLRSNVDRTEWDIRDVVNDLRQAHSDEGRAGSGLESVEQALKDALAKLS